MPGGKDKSKKDGESTENALIEYIHRETRLERKVIRAVLEAERKYFLNELVG